MSSVLMECPKCRTALPEAVFNQPDLAACPGCETRVRIEVFPAFFRPLNPGRAADSIVADDASSCFFHPQKQAVVPCGICGRFLCALCDCELHGQHLCPSCLEAGKIKGKIRNLENQRTLYDSIALSLAVLPVLVFIGIYFTFITAPAALFVAIRFWKAPLSLVRRSRIRFVIAIIFASLQVVAWAVLLFFLFTRNGHA